MIMQRYLTFLSSLLLLTTSTALPAATWIEDFSGEPADFRLERGTETLAVEIYRTLQAGDRLTVLEEDSILYLKRDDGSRIDIHKSAVPYVVQDTGQPPGPMTNLWQEIGGWLTRQRVDGVDRPVISVITRGE